jgi:hypothetical protein
VPARGRLGQDRCALWRALRSIQWALLASRRNWSVLASRHGASAGTQLLKRSLREVFSLLHLRRLRCGGPVNADDECMTSTTDIAADLTRRTGRQQRELKRIAASRLRGGDELPHPPVPSDAAVSLAM